MAGTFYAITHGGQRPAASVTGLVGAWFERIRMRRDLSRLDDRALRDIGVTRDELFQEIEKPFWRA